MGEHDDLNRKLGFKIRQLSISPRAFKLNGELDPIDILIWDSDLLRNYSSIRIIALKNLRIRIFHNTFENLPNLTSVLFENCSFENNEPLNFRNLSNLKYIYIKNCNQVQLTRNSFKGLSELIYLSFRDSKLESLPLGIFDDCTSLETIILRDCELMTLHPTIFDNLIVIKKIDLSENLLPEELNGSYIGDRITELFREKYTNILKEEFEKNHRLGKILAQIHPGIPMVLPRLIELSDLKKDELIERLKYLVEENPDIGEYLEFEQVFIKKSSEFDGEMSHFSTSQGQKDILTECDDCGSSLSVLTRTCPDCGNEITTCEICKQGFVKNQFKSICEACSSLFHKNHLYAYVQSKGECPVCKTSMTLGNL